MGLLTGAIGMLVGGAKTLIGSKTTKEILKFLATTTLSHACSKFAVNQYKFDPNDMKNMVYHYNMDNGHSINKNDIDEIINIMNINRFVNELKYKTNISGDPMNEIIKQLSMITNDNNLNRIYEDISQNDMINQFDNDTLETSSIVDNYEISSGGIYLPDNTVNTVTLEGCKLADAKNNYLEKRLNLGENASQQDISKIRNEYYNEIDFSEVIEYFSKIG